MKVHLRYRHREQLAKQLLLKGKGYNMEYRTAFAIDIMKRKKPQEFYNHRTAKFAPLKDILRDKL